MKPFQHTGVFWLPDTPERRARGELAWNGAEIALKLRDPLIVATDAGPMVDMRWSKIPVLHGDLDGQSSWEVTLLTVAGWELETAQSFAEVGGTAKAAILGRHVAPPFSTIAVQFDLLSAWVQPSPVLAGKQEHLLLVDPKSETISVAEAGDLRMRLLGVSSAHYGLNSVSINRVAQIEITGPQTDVETMLQEWVRPLQDLAILSIGDPVEITHLRLAQTNPADELYNCELLISRALRPAAEASRDVWLHGTHAPTLWSPRDHDHPFSDVVPAWFAIHAQRRSILDLLTAPFHAPFMFPSHRYTSTFQVAEGIARHRYPRTTGEKKTHKVAYKRMVEALAAIPDLPRAELEFAQRVLRDNSRQLKAQIDDLLSASGRIGQDLLAIPKFSGTAVHYRNRASHPTSEDADQLLFTHLQAAFLWILRVDLLSEAGIDKEWLQNTVVNKMGYQRTVHRLNALLNPTS